MPGIGEAFAEKIGKGQNKEGDKVGRILGDADAKTDNAVCSMAARLRNVPGALDWKHGDC